MTINREVSIRHHGGTAKRGAGVRTVRVPLEVAQAVGSCDSRCGDTPAPSILTPN